MNEKDAKIELSNRVIKRINDGGASQAEYESISANLADVRLNACMHSDESRYEEKDSELNYWMCLCDVHRRYMRIKHLTPLSLKGDKKARALLIDTYLDLANIGIMSVQILKNRSREND